VAHVVEGLLCKCKALNSNPSSSKKKKKKKKKKDTAVKRAPVLMELIFREDTVKNTYVIIYIKPSH
jgi:hypothetical protein